MKMNQENMPPAVNPHISLLEKDSDNKTEEFPGHEEKVRNLKIPEDPDKLKKSEYNEILAFAMDKILGDKFVAKLVSAMTEKSLSTMSVRKLAEIENELVEACINLSDADIDNLIAQLNRRSLQYASGNVNLPVEASRDMHSGRWNPRSEGIKSVVHFVRERSKFLNSKPAQRFIMGFNNHLDVDAKIDIIEAILGETDEDIEQLNLIQIKNSRPPEEEISDITEKHKNYALKEIMSVKDVNDLKLTEAEEEQLFRETLSNQAIMLEKIFEICVNPGESNKKALMETLGLNNLNDMQAAWVLDTYLGTIEDQVEATCNDGYIEEQDKNSLIKDLESLSRALNKKSGVPLHVARINSINSLVAVDSAIVSQEEIFNSQKSGTALAATID